MSFNTEPLPDQNADVLWPENQYVKLDITEDLDAYYLKFEFYFALKVVELIAAGVESLEVFISRKLTSASYAYFTGDVEGMESSINTYFENMLSKTEAENEEQYDAYFYDKVSITNFLSDQDISRMGTVRSSIEVTDFGEGPRSVAVADYSTIQRKFNAIYRSEEPEPGQIFTATPTPGAGTDMEYFRELSGMLSFPSSLIGDVVFPRPFTNEIFSGDSTSSNLGKIIVDDPNMPDCFWYLWSKFYHINMSVTEQLPGIAQRSTDFRPIKLTCEIPFEKNESDPTGITGRAVLVGFLVRNGCKLKIKFNSKSGVDVVKYLPIVMPLDLPLLMARSGAGLKPASIGVNNVDDVYDLVTINNPNDIGIECNLSLMGWNNASYKMEAGISWTSTIEARSFKVQTVTQASSFPSRFYQGYQKLAIINEANALSSQDLNPSIPISATVPGVANMINPLFDRPVVFAVVGETNIQLRVASKPVWADSLYWYVHPIQSLAAAAKRSPGLRREGMVCFKIDPPLDAYGTAEPSGTALLLKSNLAVGNYEIVVDLCRNGCVKDTINANFTIHPFTSYGAAVNWSFTAVKGGGGDIITTSVQIAPSTSGIIYTLMSMNSLPADYATTIGSATAAATLLVWFTVLRVNGDTGTMEECGTIGTNSSSTISLSSDTTPNRSYILRLYACTMGCIMTQNATLTLTPETNGGRGTSYYYDYAKFKNPKCQKTATLPLFREPTTEVSSILRDSYTGVSKAHSIIASPSGGAAVINFQASYDELRKSNFLSWRIPPGQGNFPIYFLVVAVYGGITAPVNWASWTGDALYEIPELTMAGALGTVVYRLFEVFADGANHLVGTTSIVHDNETYLMEVLGKGLK